MVVVLIFISIDITFNYESFIQISYKKRKRHATSHASQGSLKKRVEEQNLKPKVQLRTAAKPVYAPTAYVAAPVAQQFVSECSVNAKVLDRLSNRVDQSFDLMRKNNTMKI